MKTSTVAMLVFLSVFLLFTLILYPTLLSPPYVIDDQEILAALPAGGLSLANVKSVLRADKSVFLPLTGITYLIDQGLSVGKQDRLLWVMRLGNIFYLSLASVWLFLLIPDRKKYPLLAYLGALLFATHPLHAIPTDWIASRKDVLVCCMMLLSVLLYQKEKTFLSSLAFLAALFSKLSAYGLYFWVLIQGLANLNFYESASWKKFIRQQSFFLIPCLILLPIFTNQSSHVQKLDWVYSKTISLTLFYFGKVIWPYPILQYYSVPEEHSGFAAIGFAIVLLLFVGLARKRLKSFADAVVLALAFLIPYVIVVPIHLLVNNAYAYALVAPVVLLLFGLMTRWAHHRAWRWSGVAVMLAVVCVFAVYDRRIAVEFIDPVAAFEHNLSLMPNDFSAYQRLGQIAEAKGEIKKSLAAYQKSIEIHLERHKRIPIEGFEGMLGVALRHQQPLALEYLGKLAAKNSQPYYCQEMRRGFAEFGLGNSKALENCIKKFPREMAAP